MSTDVKKTAFPDTAVDKQAPTSNTFEGKVVSMLDNKLVMRNKEGKEHSHILAADAKLTCDGAVCKSSDFKAGNKVRVTTNKGDRNIATGIESLNKNTEFASL